MNDLRVDRATQGLAINGNQCPIHLLLDGLGPANECCLKLLWLDAGDDPGDGVMHRNTI